MEEFFSEPSSQPPAALTPEQCKRIAEKKAAAEQRRKDAALRCVSARAR